MAQEVARVIRKGSIGLTVEEDGTVELEGGRVVSKFKARPNDPEAHRRMLNALKREFDIAE